MSGHTPFAAVNRLVKLVYVLHKADSAKVLYDFEEGLGLVKYKLVVIRINLVGITHLNTHCGELKNCLCSCFLTKNFVGVLYSVILKSLFLINMKSTKGYCAAQ